MEVQLRSRTTVLYNRLDFEFHFFIRRTLHREGLSCASGAANLSVAEELGQDQFLPNPHERFRLDRSSL